MKTEPFQLILDSKVYSLSAIKRASYDFTNRAFFEISTNDDNEIIVSITIKESAEQNTIQEFLNCILDHQIRFELEQEFGSLRVIIATQAFAPLDNSDLADLLRVSVNEE